jgi:thiosulfate dehydrogenase
MIRAHAHVTIFIAAALAGACSRTPVPKTSNGVPLLAGALIPASTTMVTAWDVPQNPLADPSVDDSRLSREIKWGYKLFTNTPGEARLFAPGRMACANCHLNAGQRERSLPLVGVAGMFPEYNRRSGRLYSLNDRIVDCFWRSENGTATPDALATPASKEVIALAAYINWISEGYTAGKNPPWRGHNALPADRLIPVDRLDAAAGGALFNDKCTSCHGTDGQGVWIGDKKAAPLWGPASWNDGAGAARVYTLAGFIKYSMPYLDPGSLTEEQAQQIAAYITSKPRPAYPFKAKDYLSSPLPPDAVYYRH